MQECCLVLTTTNDLQIAEKIAFTLLELEFAACVQIDDVKSYFKWEEKINVEKEYRIIIKTTSSNYKKIESKILEMHNYVIPQIIKVNIEGGLQTYLSWLNQNSK
ncbi:MAG: divalent cation tolerance protein CutA [Rickettsia endosymbiont of Argas persicus]